MSKKLSLIVLGSILLLAQGCIFFPAVKGDGNVTTHTIDISDYDQISVDASAAVFNYTQEESAPALTVIVDQNIYDLFDFKTDDNKLVIRPKQENKTLRLRPTQFTITSNSRQLKKVDLAGAEKFNVNSKLSSNDKIKFNLAGSVMLHMKDTVTVNQLEVSIAGSGIVDALTLYANEFKCLDFIINMDDYSEIGFLNALKKAEAMDVQELKKHEKKALEFAEKYKTENIANEILQNIKKIVKEQ